MPLHNPLMTRNHPSTCVYIQQVMFETRDSCHHYQTFSLENIHIEINDSIKINLRNFYINF